ncbi:unnamed protein product [Prorocentrum cordatum]|uniref:Uncharacterized protein n=1 Tax=Prorocentrum cordatum TaxID=2364126 RepID=A0ABN9XE12_9DINO|nr:unnamed protein product [Polarella glacialis]
MVQQEGDASEAYDDDGGVRRRWTRGRRGRGASGSTSSEGRADPLSPKGAAPGAKWREGALPVAPTFCGDRWADPRCWEHWKNAVDAWRFRIERYLPLVQAALQLRDAITGKALKEIISEPPMMWADDDGVDPWPRLDAVGSDR